jgi:hypothetical protein
MIPKFLFLLKQWGKKGEEMYGKSRHSIQTELCYNSNSGYLGEMMDGYILVA